MKTRIISACVMLPLLILVYLGGNETLRADWLYGVGCAVRAESGVSVRPALRDGLDRAGRDGLDDLRL